MGSSCLQVEVSLSSPIMSLTTALLKGVVVRSVDRIGGILIEATRVDKPLNVSIDDSLVNNHLRLKCGLVCSLADVHYLRVSPSSIQWISPTYGVTYSVESDVNWYIV